MRNRVLAWLGLIRGRRVRVDGLELRVPAGVLDPQLFRVGAWFAHEVATRVRPGDRLLDLGCGSGVVGALAKAAGARVTATDVDERAVAAARANGVDDARLGDLFAPVGEDRFDLVCFNPPFFPGEPERRPYGRALYGGPRLELVRRFAAELDAHLAEGGVPLVAWSDRAPDPADALGSGWRVCAEARLLDERLFVLTR